MYLTLLLDYDKILLEATLEPNQGSRFQPTGFPSLGAAEFTSATENGNHVSSLLVESAQSMANRLEKVCLNDAENGLVKVLEGLPVVTVKDKNGKFMTNSILEAHRLNSSYMLEGEDKTLLDSIIKELNITDKESAIDISNLARFALKYDPNTILHGLFLSRAEIAGGRYKMTRSLGAFIEATNVSPAVSGGVKLDHLDPKGGEGGASEGFGHIPYSRTEYTAESIKAYFNIDLALIKSYKLGSTANEFLVTFALWKIRCFLQSGLRLRTACNFKVKGDLNVIEPDSEKIPDIQNLETDLKKWIKKCRNEELFAKTPLDLTYCPKSKKKKKDNS